MKDRNILTGRGIVVFIVVIIFGQICLQVLIKVVNNNDRMGDAHRHLKMQRLLREGDDSRLQEYLDDCLRQDLSRIAVNRRLYVRPKRSLKVAADIVDYFDTYRDGHIEYPPFREDLNDELRYIVEEVRQQKQKQVEQIK